MKLGKYYSYLNDKEMAIKTTKISGKIIPRFKQEVGNWRG